MTEEIALQARHEPSLRSEADVSLKTRKLYIAEFLLQHTFSSWTIRTQSFAIYLALVAVFPDSLLPAALYGFITSAIGTFCSSFVGSKVDDSHQLKVVQLSILFIKISSIASSVLLIIMFHLQQNSPNAKGLFAIVTLFGCVEKLATILNTVAVEREWTVTLCDGASENLTFLNTWVRRCDLLTNLLAPLWASLLLSVTSYTNAFAILAGSDALLLSFEIYCQSVLSLISRLQRGVTKLWTGSAHVYNRFSNLFKAQLVRRIALNLKGAGSKQPKQSVRQQFEYYAADWKTFIHHPIFLSSLSISLLYFTTLSFDGIFVSWLKTHQWTDGFIAGMRAVTVVTGLAGTLVMPWLERKLGLVRAGSYSIWSEVICLIPVVVAFFIDPAPSDSKGPVWNAVLIFLGIQLSRIFLWSFDLVQTKQVQLALNSDPRRNAITALQYSLQNLGDLAKYALVLILWQPSQFRFTALASIISVFSGAVVYSGYIKKERGHLFHFEKLQWLKLH